MEKELFIFRQGRAQLTGRETSQDGRPIFEGNNDPQFRSELAAAGVTTTYIPSPHADYRQGIPMNLSALQETQRNRNGIFDNFAFLREGYLAFDPDTIPGSFGALVVIADLGGSLHGYSFTQQHKPMRNQGELPDSISATIKASVGIQVVAKDLVELGLPLDTPLTSANLFHYISLQERLVKGDQTISCAAPSELIKQTLDAILTPHKGDPTKSDLKMVVPEMKYLVAFQRAIASMNLADSGFREAVTDTFTKIGILSSGVKTGEINRRQALGAATIILDNFYITEKITLDMFTQLEEILRVSLGYEPFGRRVMRGDLHNAGLPKTPFQLAEELLNISPKRWEESIPEDK